MRIDPYMRTLVPPASDEDAELRLKERLAEVLRQVQDLERENETLKTSIGRVSDHGIDMEMELKMLMVQQLVVSCTYSLSPARGNP